jgi:hypothetical protein
MHDQFATGQRIKRLGPQQAVGVGDDASFHSWLLCGSAALQLLIGFSFKCAAGD